MMRCFQGDRKMKHGKKCKIDKYTLVLIVLLLLLTGLVIAWKLPQKEDRYIHVGIAVYDRSDTFMESYIRELEDKIGQTRILGKKVSYEIYDAEGIGSRQEKTAAGDVCSGLRCDACKSCRTGIGGKCTD